MYSRALVNRNMRVRMKLRMWLAKSDKNTMRLLAEHSNMSWGAIRLFAIQDRDYSAEKLNQLEKGLNELINKDKQPA